MYPVAVVQNTIEEITEHLYPAIKEQLSCIPALKNDFSEIPAFETVSDLLGALKNEFYSLSNYEIKLLFPTLEKITSTQTITEEQCSHLLELQLLIRKKENRIADLVLLVEVESENIDLAKDKRIADIINTFTNIFTPAKQKLHINMLQLQKLCKKSANGQNQQEI